MKYCGKPGIGATGKQGINGLNGESFYIGKLNSSQFFDYITQEMLDEYNLSDIDVSYSIGEKRLHPKYKEGDTIFVLNESEENPNNLNVVKKIELTKDHVLCTEDYLRNTSGESYPLSLLYFDIDHNNTIHFPLNLVNNENYEALYILHDKYGKALINGKYVNTNILCTVNTDDISTDVSYYNYIPEIYNTELKYINTVNNGDKIYTETLDSDSIIDTSLISLKTDNHKFNITANNNGLKFNTSIDNLKIKNLYIKSNNKGNVEALNTLYNKNILLDVNGNCYTLNINDYNANTLKFTIDINKFLNNDVNTDLYHFGYIHTMYTYDPCIFVDDKIDSDVLYYHPNYINSIESSIYTYKDIYKDKDGAYIRNWYDTSFNLVKNDFVKDILVNLTDDKTFKDVYNEQTYPDFDKSLYDAYQDYKGIIMTQDIIANVSIDVIKDLDGNIIYKHYNIPGLDDVIINESKLSYDSRIISVIDPSILSIDLNMYDKNNKLYNYHDIIQWIQVPEGIKYYSKHTRAVYDEYNNTYNIITGEQIYTNNTLNIETIENVFTYTINENNLIITDINGLINDNNICIYINNTSCNDYIITDNTISVDISNILSTDIETSTYIKNESILDDLYNSSIHKVNGYKVPVTVEYKTYNNDTSLYDYYYVQSPEYTEYRTLPHVKLHIYDNIDSLEKFNDVNKGLLCNQFQFFMKVSVEDFGPDNWGKYEGDDLSNIKLNFKIVENKVDTFTNKTISTINTSSGNSIHSINTILLNKEVDIFNITCKDIDSYKRTDITLNNVSFSINDDKEFYVRVLIEFSNPDPAICHFAYSVLDLNITADNEYKSKLSTNGLYKSNHLYATIMPISLIAQYGLKSGDAYNTVAASKWYGSEDPITVSISPYKLESMQYTATRQPVNWNSYKLKNRYFQDNIESIYINTININDIYETLPDNMYNSSWIVKDSDDIYNTYLQIAYDTTGYNPVLLEDEEIFYYNNEVILNSKYNQIGNNSAVFIEQNILKDIRTKSIISSMSMWNNEYKALYYKDSDNPYKGHNSVYGNGYQYLPSTADQGQYDVNDIISLNDIKTAMEKETFENNIYTVDINKPYTYDNYTPDNMYYDLKHQIKWAYPHYKSDNDNNISLIYSLDFTNAVMSYENPVDNVMPYNLAYSIYPRILYNDEELMNIILMLRRPSVKIENMYSWSDTGVGTLSDPLNVLN